MTTQLSLALGSSHAMWLSLRGSTNPFSAAAGPVPQVTIPLEVRAADRGIQIELLRLSFGLKIGQTLIGQGELGPYRLAGTDYTYLPVTATCPQAALPYLVNPEPPHGRITLTLALKGLVRYRHEFTGSEGQAQGLGDPGVWHIESISSNSAQDLDVQVARSDWYEQVVAKLGLGSYIVTPLYLPYGLPSWQAALGHLDEAAKAIVQPSPPGVFGACRAAIDALPGDKTAIFAPMPEGKKRDAIDELTKAIGKYIHSGRHVMPSGGEEQAGEFPVNQRDAMFAQNLTKLLLSHIASLTLTA